jgi:hypothetical protein
VSLFNPGNPTNPVQLDLIRQAAPTLGVRLLSMDVRHADDIEPAGRRRIAPGTGATWEA